MDTIMTGQTQGRSSVREDSAEIVALFGDISSMLASQGGQVDSVKAVQLAAQLLPHPITVRSR